MARVALTEKEAALYHAVGSAALLRAREQLERGQLVDVRWDPVGRASGRVLGDAAGAVIAAVLLGADGRVSSVEGLCSCRQAPSCDHPTAVLLAAMPGSFAPPALDPPAASTEPAATATPTPAATAKPATKAKPAAKARPAAKPKRPKRPSAWETALSPLVREATPAQAPATAPATEDRVGIALQFELLAPAAAPRGKPAWRIVLRPVLPGRTGWMRTGMLGWDPWNSQRSRKWRSGMM